MSEKLLVTVLDLAQVTIEQRKEIKDLKCELATAYAKNEDLLRQQSTNGIIAGYLQQIENRNGIEFIRTQLYRKKQNADKFGKQVWGKRYKRCIPLYLHK